jgi:hypothetical protein
MIVWSFAESRRNRPEEIMGRAISEYRFKRLTRAYDGIASRKKQQNPESISESAKYFQTPIF